MYENTLFFSLHPLFQLTKRIIVTTNFIYTHVLALLYMNSILHLTIMDIINIDHQNHKKSYSKPWSIQIINEGHFQG